MSAPISALWFGLWTIGGLSLVAVLWRLRREWPEELRRTGLRLGWWTAAYIAVVETSVALFMVGSTAVGYYSYSDRPGPGWHGTPHIPSVPEILGATSWTIVGVWIFFQSGFALAAIARACQVLRLSLPIRMIVLGLLYGLFGTISTAGAGWYIAMGQWAVLVGSVAALSFGCGLAWRARPVTMEARRA